ncbi:hypothetical protein WG66_009799 [Moniliophthora roreri]|nr:hypothetical protein WG66_009799 [Moniliophthora roreri]
MDTPVAPERFEQGFLFSLGDGGLHYSDAQITATSPKDPFSNTGYGYDPLLEGGREMMTSDRLPLFLSNISLGGLSSGTPSDQ